jgi:6-phosphogluconolactonase
MIEAEWWDYEDVEEMADAVAGDIAFIVESALDARGEALIAVPGGKTPIPIFRKLASAKLNWKSVTIVPTDERLVPLTDPRSNVRAIAEAFLRAGARVFPIGSDITDHRLAGNAANAKLAELKFPLDLAWLGVGADGHTASIFPGPDLEEALNAPKGRHAVGVLPDPLPQDAPVARITLTRSAILSARTVLITVTGADKRAMLEGAIADGQSSRLPIGRVLAETEQPIDIHWCP